MTMIFSIPKNLLFLRMIMQAWALKLTHRSVTPKCHLIHAPSGNSIPLMSL
jgi:hypothetical protein